MSLLDTASLIVTPNGYKESKLYSVIPSDGSGDLSVTRATTATRVNSAGLVELVPYNLLSYSQDIENADWQKYQLSVIANNTTAPDGTTTADKITQTGSGAGTFYKFPYAYSSGRYTASCYFKKGTANVALIEGNPTSSNFSIAYNLDTEVITPNGTGYVSTNIENLGNGWYRCSVVANVNASTGYVAFGLLGSVGDTMFAWGAQFVEGSTAKDYQKTETRLNIPRLDYSNGTCPSLLVEPQRTNAVTYSEFFSSANGYNYQNASQSGSSIVSPSGLLAYGITSTTSANDFHRYYKTLGGRSGVNTTTIFAKKGTSRYLGLGVNQNGSTGNNNVVVFDLQDGVIASNTYGVTASIEDFGDGWYRLVHTFDYGTGGTYADICVHNTGTSTYTINAFQTFDSPSSPTTIYVWGLQMEAGSYATSYIPTTSASVTRNADVISKTGISSLIGQTEGTLFLDFYYDGSSNNHMIIRDSGYSSYIYFNSPSANQLYGQIQTINIQFSMSATAGRYKCALTYKSGSSAMYVNGTQVGTSATTFTLSGSMSEVDFTLTTPNNAINAAALWKTRLTNTQLAQLTTI